MAYTFKSPTNSTRTSPAPTRSRNNKQKARRAAAKKTPKAQPQASPTYGNDRVKKPAVVTTPLASNNVQKVDVRPNGGLESGLLPKDKTPFDQFTTSQDPKLLKEKGKVNKYKTGFLKPQTVTPSTKINPFGGAAMSSIMSDFDPSTRNTSLLTGYQNTTTSRANFDKSAYDQEADVGRDSLIRNDKYRNDNDEVSYNQAYWKARSDGGASQADMAAEQKAIGMKKAYSGDRVITQQDQQKSKYILDVLGQSGIKPTVTSETSGLFDEMTTTKSSYDIGTGKPMTTTRQQYSPVAKTKWGDLRLGDDVTKTFVNGVAVSTQKNDDAAKDSELGSLNQRSQSSPDPIKEMADIDSQIKTETDPAKLKALHKRRLMLMRMNRTNTRFAGLLGEADTKRTNLMSIS